MVTCWDVHMLGYIILLGFGTTNENNRTRNTLKIE